MVSKWLNYHHLNTCLPNYNEQTEMQISVYVQKQGFNLRLFIHELTINLGTVTEEPVPPVCVYCVWIPLCVVVLEEQNSVPLPRATDVC